MAKRDENERDQYPAPTGGDVRSSIGLSRKTGVELPPTRARSTATDTNTVVTLDAADAETLRAALFTPVLRIDRRRAAALATALFEHRRRPIHPFFNEDRRSPQFAANVTPEKLSFVRQLVQFFER